MLLGLHAVAAAEAGDLGRHRRRFRRPIPNACRAAKGACWGFIVEKFRLMIFGTYPYAEQWRPMLTMVMLLTLIGSP